MLRTFVLAAAFGLVSGLAQANENAVSRVVHIEGYLDEAPAEASVTEEVRITRDGKDRVLYVVTARPATNDHPGRVFRDAQNQQVALHLDGPDAARMLEAEAGSKIEGTFTYQRSLHRLQVQNVD